MVAEITLNLSILQGTIKHGFFHILSLSPDHRVIKDQNERVAQEHISVRPLGLPYETRVPLRKGRQNFLFYNRNLPHLSIRIFAESFVRDEKKKRGE